MGANNRKCLFFLKMFRPFAHFFHTLQGVLTTLPMKIRIILLIIIGINFFYVSSGQKSGKTITITGEVNDSLQKPVKGAIIFIDSKKTSAITDKKGRYKVQADPDSKEILAYSPQGGVSTSKINRRVTINLTLDHSTKFNMDSLSKADQDEMLDMGYGNMKKKNITSDKATLVNPRFSSYSNIYDMIKGEVPGVQVRGTSVYVQGISTFGGSSEALFVVDGIVVDQINDILPNDVKSIQLLKGPATSVYGMQGANGVIFIKTMRGTDKK